MSLADTIKYFNVMTILTTSCEYGPDGPMLPELKAMFPNSACIPHSGQINAWDSEEFVKGVRATSKNQSVISGIVTNVCVTSVALSAMDVFVVIDACGTFMKLLG